MGTPDNPRQREKAWEKRLVATAFFLLVGVGGLLIGLLYGAGAAATALPCLLGGGLAILLLYGFVNGLEAWRNRIDY